MDTALWRKLHRVIAWKNAAPPHIALRNAKSLDTLGRSPGLQMRLLPHQAAFP